MKLNEKGISAVVIIVIIAVLAVAGGGAWYYFANDSGEDSETTNEEASNNSSVQLAEPPYRITTTVTDTANEGANATAVVDYESEKLWKIEAESEEGTSEFVYDGEYTYVTANGETIRTPAGESESSTQIDAYTVNEDDLNTYRNSAAQLDDVDCNAGTCEVYRALDVDGTDKVTIHIDKDSNRVIMVEVVDGTTTSVIEFDFNVEVKVEVPTDFTEVELPPQIQTP